MSFTEVTFQIDIATLTVFSECTKEINLIIMYERIHLIRRLCNGKKNVSKDIHYCIYEGISDILWTYAIIRSYVNVKVCSFWRILPHKLDGCSLVTYRGWEKLRQVSQLDPAGFSFRMLSSLISWFALGSGWVLLLGKFVVEKDSQHCTAYSAWGEPQCME